ncbi:MAG: phosphoribosylpyrophosphate synthetase, partial [Desulfobacca sp.]
PVLSGPAIDRIEASVIKRLVVTDTIPLSEAAKKSEKIVQLTVAPLFCKAITNIHREDSISSIFDIQF